MKKPVIGITCDNSDTSRAYSGAYAYVDAVIAAGGLPLLLPFHSPTSDIPQLVDLLHGIIFTGGNDLNPTAWNETYHPKATPVEPAREKYERALMTEVESRRLPTLGICLGSQLMNVHRGGSMRQFIPELNLSPTLEHRKTEGKDGRHEITVHPNTLLAKIIGPGTHTANSAHKQAMGTLGKNLILTATSPDGIPEALEDPTMPLWLGVQWHPERIHTEPPHNKLFEHLVAVSSKSLK